MSSINNYYMADIVFDGSDGEMKVRHIWDKSFTKLIEKIEQLESELDNVEVWAARYLIEKEGTSIKQKVLATLNRRKNGQ